MPKKACCVVPHCRNSSEKTASLGVTYQKFPSKEKIRRRWVRAIQAMFGEFIFDDTTTQRLCSEHFEDNSFMINKNGKEVLKIDAVPTIFNSPVVKKEKDAVSVRPRHQSRRAASKEALKQMQILLEDEDDAVEIPDDDYVYKGEVKEEPAPVPAAVSPPKKKYKLSHRKSSDDREVLVLKSITPSITNHDIENNLELECWVEELEPCQKERNQKLEEENKALQAKLDELLKECNGEVVYKGDLTTVIEVAEHVQKTIQAVQASQNKPPIVLNSAVANPQPYQLVVDPRIGLIVGSVSSSTTPTPTKQSKIQVATNLQAPVVTPSSQTIANRNRLSRTKKQTPIISTTAAPPPPLTPVTSRSVLAPKPTNKRSASQPPPQAPPATRSRGNEIQPPAAPTPPVTRSRPGANAANTKPSESNVEGGLTTGRNVKGKAIVDLTTDDGRPLPDSREVSFNKLQGKTFPSLVVVARPHLRVSDVNSDRSKLDAKVKSVLMYLPTKFTEWLIQQGLIKSEQTCTMHSTSQLKLGMYSDVTKFPYSGGYVWISECCPQRFVSVFSGSIFEGSQHPPLVILKILYHWACQTNIQNVTQWVKVDNLYVKGMYTWLRSVCTLGLQTHIRKLGGPQTKVEVGVISLGTTSQDGNSRQVKVEVLGILERTSKLIRLRAIEPLVDGEKNYKKRFSKILEPLEQWVHPSSIIVTDLTVDRATLHQMGFTAVMQPSSTDGNSNKTVMDYLRRIVPRMFQNTLSLLSRQIIQQFLDELVWREWYGTTSMQAFDNLISHLAEQTRFESNQSLVVRLTKIAANPFKQWVPPPGGSNAVVPAPAAAVPAKPAETLTAKKRKRKDTEPPTKPTSTTSLELNRPPKSTSPDVPEQMVPLENYYYGTIDNYPPKTNVTLNLKCPFCKEVYNNNIVLMNHLFKHAHNVSKDGQMCRYCLTSLSTANDLLKHIATAHPSDTKHDNGFVCLICETQYMNPFVLGKHLSREHCPSELPYQCGTCGYRCSNHKQAIDHFHKQHDNGPTIQCPFCLKSTTVFSSSRNIGQNMHYFIQHLQKHQKKQFAKRCGKCNLWFVQKDVLKDHQMRMHASQRGKSGLVPWVAPRNGVMVPKSKMDKYPCDGEGINFGTLFYNVSKGLKCKECDGLIESSKHFPSFESCQNPNCQYSTCCSKAMQDHNAKCNKNSQRIVSEDKLPYDMFCICGYSSKDGNQMAKHLATCEKKSAYPSLSDAKSASVTHSMLDVLGLVRKPEEGDKKVSAPRSVKRMRRSEAGSIALDDDETSRDSMKSTRGRKSKKQNSEADKKTEAEVIDLIDDNCDVSMDLADLKPYDETDTNPVAVQVKHDILEIIEDDQGKKKTDGDTAIILEDESTDSSVTTENTPVVNAEESDEKSEVLTSSIAEADDIVQTSEIENVLLSKDDDLEEGKEGMFNDKNQADIVELSSPEPETANLNEDPIEEPHEPKDEDDDNHDAEDTTKDVLSSDIPQSVDDSLSDDAITASTSPEATENTEVVDTEKISPILGSDSFNMDKVEALSTETDELENITQEEDNTKNSLKNLDTKLALQNTDSGKSDYMEITESITPIERASSNNFTEAESSASPADILRPAEQTEQEGQSNLNVKEAVFEMLDQTPIETEGNSVTEESGFEILNQLEETRPNSDATSVVEEPGADDSAQMAAEYKGSDTSNISIAMEID